MINVKTDDGRIEVRVKGDLGTLVTDISLIVYSVYEGIRKDDALKAEIFKRYFCEEGSAIFDVGDEDVAVTKKEPKRSNTDVMDMFINRLDELSAILKAEKAKKEDK